MIRPCRTSRPDVLPDDRLSWRQVAIELLRRRAGAAPVLSDHELHTAGAEHARELDHRRMDSLYFLACDPTHPRQRLYQLLFDAQVAEARAVLAELAELGVDGVAFKSIEVGMRYDRGRAVGARADVDLLLPSGGLWKVRKVLYGRGYRHGRYVPDTREWAELDPRIALRHETTAYELMPFVRAIALPGVDDAVRAEARQFPGVFCVHDDATLVFVCFDIHHNILFNLDIAPFFARSVASSLGAGRALSPADHLWFAIQRHYFEVASGDVQSPRPLASISAMVRDPEIDWDIVLRNAVAQRAISPCWYWLSFFRKLGVESIPPRVFVELRSQLRICQRSWGWQIGRMFGIDEPFADHLVAPAGRAALAATRGSL